MQEKITTAKIALFKGKKIRKTIHPVRYISIAGTGL